MPLSNIKKEGFENKIAELLAKDLGWKLDYKWFPQRLAFSEIQFGQKTQALKAGLLVTLQSALRLTQRGHLVQNVLHVYMGNGYSRYTSLRGYSVIG